LKCIKHFYTGEGIKMNNIELKSKLCFIKWRVRT